MKKNAGIPPILKKIMIAKALAGAGAGGPPPGAGGPPPGAGGPPPGMGAPPPAMKKGGSVKKFAKGGSIDGIASKGKTKTSMVKMKKGGRC